MGRSNPYPILRNAAGARLTTIRRTGKLKPELVTAAVTRSLLSLIVPSGRPTMLKVLSPMETSTSTTTGWASIPSTEAEFVLAIIQAALPLILFASYSCYIMVPTRSMRAWPGLTIQTNSSKDFKGESKVVQVFYPDPIIFYGRAAHPTDHRRSF